MKLALFSVSLFFSSFMYSQTSYYIITKPGRKYSVEQLNTALSKADWCGYFHYFERYQIIFDDGTEVELISKKEMTLDNLVNDECFQSEKIKDDGIYSVHESGRLLRMLSARNTSKN